MPEAFLDMAVARPNNFTSDDPFEQGLNTSTIHPDFAHVGKPGFGKVYTFSTDKPSALG